MLGVAPFFVTKTLLLLLLLPLSLLLPLLPLLSLLVLLSLPPPLLTWPAAVDDRERARPLLDPSEPLLEDGEPVRVALNGAASSPESPEGPEALSRERPVARPTTDFTLAAIVIPTVLTAGLLRSVDVPVVRGIVLGISFPSKSA